MKRKTHGGTCAVRHRMRCSRGKSGCNRRFTLRRPLLSYKTPPKCPHCGCTKVRDVERERRDEQNRRDLCNCNAYPFPHNAGSLRMCLQSPLLDVDPTEQEIHEYRACLDTPRSDAT